MHLFRKKAVDIIVTQSDSRHSALRKSLGAFDLTMLGIGCIIGTGIFVLTGVAAARHAGPALVLSFIIAGLACGFAALSYAEFASTVPAAGSVYTYSYATFGEIIAWILGWDMVLEYGLAASLVASGWSGYAQGLLTGFGLHVPAAFSSAFNPAKGTFVDVPAMIITLLLTFLLSRGVKESSRFTSALVFIKVAVILLFIVVGIKYVKPANWHPFMPFGLKGVASGAATAFLAYLGFDAVSTAAEEVKNPQRNVPIGILASLALCTLLYVAVSAILTGMVPYSLLDVKNPVAFALQYVHQDWVAGFISLGAIMGITTVLMVLLYGQTRLFYAISRDGLLPKALSSVNKKTNTPTWGCWLTGALVSVFAGVLPLERLADLTNIGTLFAFMTVSIGVIVLRKTQPDLPRSFRVPLVPWIPLLSVAFCAYLLLQLPQITWAGFGLWFIVGIILYILYGYKNSELAHETEVQSKTSSVV